jgi:hypothetical protein
MQDKKTVCTETESKRFAQKRRAKYWHRKEEPKVCTGKGQAEKIYAEKESKMFAHRKQKPKRPLC